MKRSISLILLSFFLSFALVNAEEVDKYPTSLITSSKVFDFGSISEGKSVSTSFKIKNISDFNIAIQSIVSDCGCVVANIEDQKGKPKNILPKQEITLPVKFFSTGFSGSQNRKVIVKTTDQQKRVVEFSIRGFVKPNITFSPKVITFDTTLSKLGVLNGFNFKVFKRNSSDKFRVTSLRPEIRIEKVKETPNFYLYKAFIHEKTSILGEFQTYISIVKKLKKGLNLAGKSLGSNAKGLKKLRSLIPVLVNVNPDVIIKPSVQSLGVVPDDREVFSRFKVHFSMPELIHRAKYEVSDSSMRISSVEKTADGSIVTVALNPSKVSGDGLDGGLTVTYGDDEKTATARVIMAKSLD